MPDPSVRPGDNGPPADGSSLRIQILGPLKLWRDGAEIDAGPPQQVSLLALLVARVGKPTSTGELVDLIWGEDAPPSAVNIIQKYVGGLRRVLEPGLAAHRRGSLLHRRGTAYLFTARPGMLDLGTFREKVAAAQSAQHPEAALDHYVDALDLWRGPPGGGIVTSARSKPVFAALGDEFHDAAAAAAALAVSLRQPDRVLPALRLATSMAPFREPVQASLIDVLSAAGRHAEALTVFGTVRDRLADELGIDPGPALVAAHRKIPTAQQGSGTTGLVGRTDEIATLGSIVDSALAGGTAIGVVEGEAGVGKTRLLEAAAAAAGQRGALVVWGTCLQGDGTPSMWPWERVLGSIVDSLPAPSRANWLAGELSNLLEPVGDRAPRAIPDSNAHYRLFEQVVAVVGQAAARRPTLLILDDLQWADAASLELLTHLARRLPAGTAIVGAFRDRAPTPGSGLSRLLAAVSRLPGHRRFRLGPLDLAAVAELIRQETGHEASAAVVRSVLARTAGNAFFVRELSRLLGDGGAFVDGSRIPSTVRDVVRDRMGGLDDHTCELLHIAALIGRDVDLGLLARAAGVDAADCLTSLEPLHALGLLETGPDDPFSVRFAHDIVRESVSESTTGQRAILLHLRIADALEATRADDDSGAERLAYHCWAAGPLADAARTAEALVRAGRRAASKLAFDAAGRHLQAAARIARTAGLGDLELSVLTLVAVVARRQSRFDGPTFDLLERAEHLARMRGREADAADFLFIRVMGAYTFMVEHRATLARRMHEQGQASSDPTVRLYGRSAWGLHLWDVGDIGEAVRSFAGDQLAGPDTLTPLRRDGSIPGEGPGWWAVTTALQGDVETAQALVDTWDDPDDPYAVSVWTYYTTMIASLAGDAVTARRAGERWSLAGLDRLNMQIDHYIRQNWCWARALTGDRPADAAAEAEELLTANLLDPPRWGIAYHHGLIAEMWLAAGLPDQAAVALDRAEQALDAVGQRYAEGLLLLLRARLLDARGEPVSAVRTAAQRARAHSAERGAHLFARRAELFLSGLAPSAPPRTPPGSPTGSVRRRSTRS
ncbi:transcriptional regulator [Asanoa ferruginea]|uniref:Transcriptional regulator n=1 Tax=Asanoa ferruginea TaxID=53367 RepID=A0A3D9ZYB7_9ACTN|nr:AAA family ATPase [Asanoa ferruginea]REG01154.1 transcriptional regulator [Asanoa ferruginea]GIF47142.1 hypothetical protein Afe04nite_16810 [Asanoa ferruginea]